jgi:hypothetical protein
MLHRIWSLGFKFLKPLPACVPPSNDDDDDNEWFIDTKQGVARLKPVACIKHLVYCLGVGRRSLRLDRVSPRQRSGEGKERVFTRINLKKVDSRDGSTLVVKIKKTQESTPSVPVMPKKNNRDKKNIVLLPVASTVSRCHRPSSPVFRKISCGIVESFF